MTTEPDQNGWQPIETAPQDGTRIDVWAVGAESMESRRFTDVCWEAMTNWTGHEFDGWSGCSTWAEIFEPTHWRPLPQPPVQP